MNDNAPDSWPDWSEPPSDSSLRLPSLPRRPPVVERLMAEAIRIPEVARYRKRAQFTFLCGDDPNHLGGYEGQLEVVGRCLEWFVFDCRIPEFGQSPAKHWYALQAGQLSPTDNTLIGNCLNFLLGIFEITEVTPCESFIAKDLLRGGIGYRIVEKVISEETEPGQLLLSRIFPHQQDYTLSGMAVLMNESATWEFKKFIRDGRLKPELVLPDLDGLQLENLIGRSMRDINRIEDLAVLEKKLQFYFDTCYPESPSYAQIRQKIDDTENPTQLIAHLDREIEFFNRHESDVVLSLILAVWDKAHQNESGPDQ